MGDELNHPDTVKTGVVVYCTRCAAGRAVYKLAEPLFDYQHLCEGCHSVAKGLLHEFMLTVRQFDEQYVVKLVAHLKKFLTEATCTADTAEPT